MKPYTAPRIVERELTQKWFVTFHYVDPISLTKKRFQVYSGKVFGMPGHGNAMNTLKERREFYAELCTAVTKALQEGYNPFMNQKWPDGPVVESIGLAEAMDTAIRQKAKYLKPKSINNLWQARDKVLREIDFDVPVDQVTPEQIRAVMYGIEGSNTLYNNVRRDLHAIFAHILEAGHIKVNPVQVPKRRQVASSNVAYTLPQLRTVMDEAKKYHENLYLCMCFMFMAFLRPSYEVGTLKRKDLDFDTKLIKVQPKNRKSGDFFVRPMRAELILELTDRKIDCLAPDAYIFSPDGGARTFSEDYFKRAFTRLKSILLLRGQITLDQTLYSVRHTAACVFYENTKDVEELQRLMGHSDLKTTLGYLRSLGIFRRQINVEDLPKL